MNRSLTESKTLVLLDNGHGVDTPGKRSPKWSDGTQLFEWDFNRKVVENIIKYLSLADLSYIQIVTETNDISLKERCDRVNKICKELGGRYKIYLLSVHGNAADNAPTANGIEVWTTVGQTKSDPLAEVFFKKLKDLGWKTRVDLSDGDSDKEENFYILKNTVCPAVLTENGFYTNEEECKKLLDFYWQKQIALCHYKAIQEIEYKDNL